MHGFKTPPIVEVEWIDHYCEHGWRDRKERMADRGSPRAGICKSVGYLVQDDDEWFSVALSINAVDDISETMRIYKRAVLGRRTLRRGK